MNTETLHTKTDKLVVPQLRFAEFEEDWKEKELGEICTIKTGGRDTQDRIDSGEYPFFVRSNTVEKIDSYSFDGEAILTSGDGVGVGKNFHYIKGKFDYHQRVYALRSFHKDYSGEFTYHLFAEKFYRRVYRLSAKNSVDSVRMEMISKMNEYFPTLPEQQKIAGFLTAVDTKIQQLTQKKALLEQYKKGVMQQLFSQQLRFKQDDGSDYPDWEEKKLGEVGKIVSGLTYSPKDIVEQEEGVLVLRSSNVQDRKLDFKDNVFVKVDSYNPVQENDVLICVRNGSKRLIGKNARINRESEGLAFGAFMTIYRSDYNDFLLHYFDSEEYKKEVHKNLGATINSINGSDLKKFKIPFPSKEEQRNIASYLSALDTKIESVAQQIAQTQLFKKGLLQQLFV